MDDTKRRALAAYEQSRFRAAIPYLFAALLAAVAVGLLGSDAWPLAVLMGVVGAAGHWRGQGMGYGAAAGTVVGLITMAFLACYASVGCCGDSCGSCALICATVCGAAGAAIGVVTASMRGVVAGLVAAMLGAASVLPMVGASWSALAVGTLGGLLAGAGVRFVRGG